MLAFSLAVAVLVVCLPTQAATYRQGCTGSTVRTIQTKLKRWGYYTGTVDGVYGRKTVDAVKYFQRANGLTADDLRRTVFPHPTVSEILKEGLFEM